MNSAADFMPVDRLRDIQNRKFMKRFRYTYDNVRWYRDLLASHNVDPNSIHSIDDISKLPFIVKTDLRDTYPTGMLAANMEDIVRFHGSSGTTGKPIVVPYTREDLDVWAECIGRCLTMFGVDEHDVLQVSFGYGLFSGGVGLHDGGQHRGCAVVPASGGNTARQLMLIKDLDVTVIACTPSYFLHIVDTARKIGYNWKETKLRVGIFGAEPWTEGMRQFIEDETGIVAYDIYGLTEISGPGVGGDCSCHAGIHIFEDHFYPEIIDPETLEPLPDGEEGELVFTTLDKTGLPMLRYRTRDMTRLLPEPCACGRTCRRIGRISHRSDDMMIIRGVNVFPGQIESVLTGINGGFHHYQIHIDKNDSGLATIEVKFEATPEMYEEFKSAPEKRDELAKTVADKLRQTVGIGFKTTVVDREEIPRNDGKSQRIVDHRKKN
jgi:phenylacetate-CoA ligase